MRSIWDSGDEFDRADREMRNFIDENRVADRLREPALSLPEKPFKQFSIPIDGSLKYSLPDDIKEIIAVTWREDEITEVYLNEDDYSIEGNRLLFTVHRPQPGKHYQVTYYCNERGRHGNQVR